MTATVPRPISTGAESGRQRYVEIGLVFLVFFVFGGTPAPQVNETHYLTKAKHYWNPDWCAGDLFLESADAHLTFYWTVGILTKWFSLPWVAWIGRIVAWGTLAWSLQRLSHRVIRLPWVTVLVAMLFVTLIERMNFAGEWVVGGVEGKCFAYTFVLWGLSELVANRWRLVWPLMGLASAFHVLVGGWSVVCAAIVWRLEASDSRPTLVSMLPALFLGGVLALPGVVPALLLTGNVPEDVRTEANQIYVFERLPHHLAVHQLPTDEIISRFRRFGLLLLGLCLFTCSREKSAIAENLPLQRIQRFAFASVAISVAGLVWEIATIHRPALSASVLKYYWFRLADIAVPLAVSLSLGAVLASVPSKRHRFAIAIVTLSVAIPGFLLMKSSLERWARVNETDTHQARHAYGWQDACKWARDHTAANAMFLIPRRGYDFKWYAERPVFFTWKDVPQDAESLVIWWQRYLEVYHGATDEFGDPTAYHSLQELGIDHLRAIAAKHKIDYLLTAEYPPLSLPIAYENPWYKIYDVRQEKSSAKNAVSERESDGSTTEPH